MVMAVWERKTSEKVEGRTTVGTPIVQLLEGCSRAQDTSRELSAATTAVKREVCCILIGHCCRHAHIYAPSYDNMLLGCRREREGWFLARILMCAPISPIFDLYARLRACLHRRHRHVGRRPE